MQFMWADTLLAAERAHLLRLVLWSAASVLVGTAQLALVRATRHRSSLLDQFGIQNAIWGLVELLLAGWGLRTLALRDLAAATRLDRLLWLDIGLDTGFVMVGVTLIVAGARLVRRPALVGAGLGVLIQGCALAVLHLVLAAQISR